MEIKSKNVVRFEKLKEFVLEILPILKILNIKPVLWGSFAYIGYSKDVEMSVNDIDFLIPKKFYPKLLEELKKRNLKYNYVEGWDCIQVLKDQLMIEFDPIENYPIDNFEEIDFGQFKLNAISLKDLTRRYKLASEDKRVLDYSIEKKKNYKIKFEKLQNISK